MTDWITDGEAGSSVRSKLNTLRNVISLTTGASPITVTPQQGKVIYHITSGGTAGDEIILLDDFPLTGSYAPDQIDSTVLFILSTKTAGGDVVKIQRTLTADDNTFDGYDRIGNFVGYATELVLSTQGHFVGSMWRGEWWDVDVGGNHSATVIIQRHQPLPEVPSYRDAVLVSQSGTARFIRDPGMGYMDAVPTTGASPTVLNESTRNSYITTGGTGGVEQVSLSAANSHPGLNHLIILLAKTNAGDSVSLDVSNVTDSSGVAVSSVVFSTVGQWLLLECWDEPGTVWRIQRGSATVT